MRCAISGTADEIFETSEYLKVKIKKSGETRIFLRHSLLTNLIVKTQIIHSALRTS